MAHTTLITIVRKLNRLLFLDINLIAYFWIDSIPTVPPVSSVAVLWLAMMYLVKTDTNGDTGEEGKNAVSFIVLAQSYVATHRYRLGTNKKKIDH